MDTVTSRPKVCRNLFGSPSMEEASRFRKVYKETIQEESLQAQMKYNFDFDKDEPLLVGNYEWVGVAEPNCPSFYTKGYAPTKFRSKVSVSVCRKRKLSFDSDSDTDNNTCNTEGTSDVQNDSGFISSQECTTVDSSKKMVQTQLPRFMKKKKKGSTQTAASKAPRLSLR